MRMGFYRLRLDIRGAIRRLASQLRCDICSPGPRLGDQVGSSFLGHFRGSVR